MSNVTRRHFVIPFLNVRFRMRPMGLSEFVSDGVHWLVESLIYAIGPILIVLALGIIYILTYTFATILIPMLKESYSMRVVEVEAAASTNPSRTILVLPLQGRVLIALHIGYVAFVVCNILYNYFYCVFTKHSGANYNAVVRELAQATNFVYPETPSQVSGYKREFEDRMALRIRRRRAREREESQRNNNNNNNVQSITAGSETTPSPGMTQRRSGSASIATDGAETPGDSLHNNCNTSIPMGADSTTATATSTTTTQRTLQLPQKIRQWTLLAPFEWAFCINSHQPKPPRSHYDHVSKVLVLNLDHYCPWMFNSIGYFNYRYFVNFLIFCAMGMLYGALLTLRPFLWLGTQEFRQQWKEQQQQQTITMDHGFISQHRIQPWIPHRNERMLISLAFMLCTAVGLAVLLLGGFHIYLVCTAQTTVEFHANWMARKRAKSMGQKWKNPYSLGNWYRNWQQVYGQDRLWWVAMLPSNREPEVLPAPVPGKEWRKRRQPRIEKEETVLADDDEKTERLDEVRIVTV